MKVLLAGGGTGGTLTPLLAIADHLASRHRATVRFITSGNQWERDFVAAAGFSVEPIPSGKWRRYRSFANLIDLFRIAAGFVRSLAIIRRTRPDVVVSAGSFVGTPVVWAARVTGTPALIHQPDVVPGLANRLARHAASAITVGFPAAAERFGRRKATVCGNPVRPVVASGNAERAREQFGITGSLPVVFVVGGGTGAATLNGTVVDALPALSGVCTVLHSTGRGKLTHPAGPGYVPREFIGESIGDAYALSDLVVCRAGANTIAELSLLGKPAILVPLPDSAQGANADWYAGHGAAEVISGSALTSDTLVAAIRRLITDRAGRSALARAAAQLATPDAAECIAQKVVSLITRP